MPVQGRAAAYQAIFGEIKGRKIVLSCWQVSTYQLNGDLFIKPEGTVMKNLNFLNNVISLGNFIYFSFFLLACDISKVTDISLYICDKVLKIEF